jgi:O-antigen/teichoic acid export membrane protein
MGAHSVGVFSAAYEFTQYVIGTLLIVVHLAAFPLVMARYAADGQAGAQQQLKSTCELVIALALPVCVGFALLANEISAVFLGEEFRDGAVAIIPLISFALLLSVVKSYYFDYAFQIAKSTVYQLVCMAVAAFCVVIANVILIPLYGLSGAAYASCIGFAVALLMSIVLGKRVFVMPALPYRALAQVVLGTSLMAGAVALISVEHSLTAMLLKAIVGSLVYVVVLLSLDFYQCRTKLKERYFAR